MHSCQGSESRVWLQIKVQCGQGSKCVFWSEIRLCSLVRNLRVQCGQGVGSSGIYV